MVSCSWRHYPLLVVCGSNGCNLLHSRLQQHAFRASGAMHVPKLLRWRSWYWWCWGCPRCRDLSTGYRQLGSRCAFSGLEVCSCCRASGLNRGVVLVVCSFCAHSGLSRGVTLHYSWCMGLLVLRPVSHLKRWRLYCVRGVSPGLVLFWSLALLSMALVLVLRAFVGNSVPLLTTRMSCHCGAGIALGSVVSGSWCQGPDRSVRVACCLVASLFIARGLWVQFRSIFSWCVRLVVCPDRSVLFSLFVELVVCCGCGVLGSWCVGLVVC